MRISVTNLDAYRYYRDHEESSLDDLLARLRKEVPPTPAMLAGSALHAALEYMRTDADVLHSNGHTFRFTEDFGLPLPAVRELKGEIEIETPSGTVTLVGVVDGIGLEIADHKLTARWDAEKYADSYQWRCYLVMFGGARFTYNVFVGKEIAPQDWHITEFHRLPLYAYVGMRDDVVREVSEFAAFLKEHPPESRSVEALLLASVNANAAASQG